MGPGLTDGRKFGEEAQLLLPLETAAIEAHHDLDKAGREHEPCAGVHLTPPDSFRASRVTRRTAPHADATKRTLSSFSAEARQKV